VVARRYDGDAPTPHDLEALRRRFKGPHGWRPIVINEIELFPISSVTVTRYRWRGTTIPSSPSASSARYAANASIIS
jgi:hypothetical protein